MKKIFLILILLSSICVSYASEQSDFAMLDNADKFFTSLKNKNYQTAWGLLSAKSRNVIESDVYDAVKSAGHIKNVTRKDVDNDFAKCDNMCREFWDSFVVYMNPDFVLKDSEWRLGEHNSDHNEIIFMYKTSEKPAILKMYKENGIWKVGLTESFWLRKIF